MRSKPSLTPSITFVPGGVVVAASQNEAIPNSFARAI